MKRKKFKIPHLKDNIQLFTLALPAIVLLAVFSYWPMYGIILAFKNYKVPLGMWGSPWVGLKNFLFFFQAQDAWRVTRNTLLLNFLFITVTLVCAVGFALLMFEVKSRAHVKIYQTVSILPNFLSWVAVSYMSYALLEPTKGILNRVIESMGGEGISWYAEPGYWPVILLIIKIWHGVGIGSIVYYAALMGVDSELYEAADIDGATKLQKIRYISLPCIVPIITIRLIMAIGKIFRGDFGLFYNVTRDQGTLYPTTDIIDTYVYRALMNQGNVGMSSAVSLFQSVVCFITLMITNSVVKKINPENSLF